MCIIEKILKKTLVETFKMCWFFYNGYMWVLSNKNGKCL